MITKYIVEAPQRWKYNGTRYNVGDKFEIEEKDIDSFPSECITKKEVESELEQMGIEELYEIMQDLDINPRTKIREQGKRAMIESIRNERGE